MYRKGSFGDRLSAFIVDQILVFLFALLLIFLLNIVGVTVKIDDVQSIAGLLFIIYSTLFIWRTGATIGKRLMKLKVVDTEYKPVSFWRAFLRESIGKILSSILNLGYLWMLINKRKQTWHDKIAKTLVVKLDQNNNLIPIQAEEEITGKRKVLFAVLFLLFGLPIAAASIFLIIYIFIARPFQIAGQAMAPNYVNGQYYLSTIIGARDPQRSDVVVFKYPKDPERDFIKRVIGLPGETVVLRNGEVYVNNNKLDESSYLKGDVKTYGGAFLQEGQEVVVPEGKYFVLGDNRPNSSDSREWGFVPKDNIVGKIAFCYYKCSASK